jgi:uncharacterized protein (TIGR02145 family)
MGILNTILTVKRVQLGSYMSAIYNPYKARVLADSGLIKSEVNTKAFIQAEKTAAIWDNFIFVYLAEAGYKHRVASATQSFWTKLYSIKGTIDATQTTEVSQLYKGGEVAPNEKQGLYNPNMTLRFMSIPAQTFTTNTWNMAFGGMWNGSSNAVASIAGKGSDTLSNIMLRVGSANRFSFQNESGTTVSGAVGTTNKIIGKNALIHFDAKGTTLDIYINAVFVETLTVNTNFVLSQIIKGSATSAFAGSLKELSVRTGNLTLPQLQADYNAFNSLYPIIPTVNISGQEWATDNLRAICTPMGNVIGEVTDNANVEQLTNPTFTGSATGWQLGTNWAYGTNNVVGTAATASCTQSKTTYAQYYKATIVISGSSSGGIKPYAGGQVGLATSGDGTFVSYFKGGTTGLIGFIVNTAFTGNVESCNIELVGWSDLTNLYDYIYAATAGTAAVKEKAACLAAGAWCSYSNSADNEAIYGKLYNWYAARLFDLDITEYNTANPTALWGYRIPTSTDFTTLQTNLGGSAVAGGKMKVAGLNYWTTPNTGADNSSGFSGLECNYRGVSGGFSSLNHLLTCWGVNGSISSSIYVVYNNTTTLIAAGDNKIQGFSIRVIKQ